MGDGLVRVYHTVPNRARICEDFEVIPSLKVVVLSCKAKHTYLIGLVTPEVDLIVVILDELEAEGFVPAYGEDVEGDLASHREPKV